MIPKQWFEKQGIQIKKYEKEISYSIKLMNKNRKILFFTNEKEHNLFNLDISFYEYEIYLAMYEVDYFNESDVRILIKNWLNDLLDLETIKKQYDHLVFTSLYEYYLKFGKNAKKAYSWDRAKIDLKRFELANTTIEIIYELCRKVEICNQFSCVIRKNDISLIYQSLPSETILNIFQIEVISEQTYLVHKSNLSYNANPKYINDVRKEVKEFTTPHEAVAYLEMLLIEYLKQ